MDKWWIRLLAMILGAISGPMREDLITFAKAFREKARQTKNPWDDFLADIICWAIGIP